MSWILLKTLNRELSYVLCQINQTKECAHFIHLLRYSVFFYFITWNLVCYVQRQSHGANTQENTNFHTYIYCIIVALVCAP